MTITRDVSLKNAMNVLTSAGIEIRSAGAYTTTYASVAFTGFEPIKTYCV